MHKRLLGVVLALALAGCERVVSIELPEGPKRLVVEARLERIQGQPSNRQRVRLTTTDAYFSNAAPPAARGASVQVADDAGLVVLFVESSSEPGVYETGALVPQVGRRYTLRIEWGGDRYEASERLEPVAPIDSLYFADRKEDRGPATGKRATIDLRDPAGVKNYYLWDQFVDGVRQIASDSTSRARVIASDDLIDGQRVRAFQPYGGVVIRPGQEVLVRQISLSEASHRYYLALSDQTSDGGSPFAVAPSSVRGNVANLTRPSQRALGYFMAAEVAEARATLAAQ